MRDGVKEARLPGARLLRLLPAASEIRVLTDDLRFVCNEQIVGEFQVPVLSASCRACTSLISRDVIHA